MKITVVGAVLIVAAVVVVLLMVKAKRCPEEGTPPAPSR